MEEILDFLINFKDWLAGIFSFGGESVLELVGSFFSTVFFWIFGFITGEFLSTISGFGITFFDKISSTVSSTISDGQFIYFAIGALISFPLFKIAISIIRG